MRTRGILMKKFFATHSYSMVKMFLNQFAIAIFGFTLFLATQKAGNVLLRNLTSVFAVAFYLFLIYTMTWEIGYKDRVSVELGKKKAQPWTGAMIALCANVPNVLLAIAMMLSKFCAWDNIGSLATPINSFLNGMYVGLLANLVNAGQSLLDYWFMFFLIPLPAIIAAGLAYAMGLKDLRLTKLSDPLVPESDREPRSKKKTWGDYSDKNNK